MKKLLCAILLFSIFFHTAALTEGASPRQSLDVDNAYDIVLHVDFIPNLLLSTYDVLLRVDGGELSVLPHGESSDYSFALTGGEHVISFENADNPFVRGDARLSVSSDLEVAYTIHCSSDEVAVEELYVDRDIELAEGEIKLGCNPDSLRDKPLEAVIQALQDMGFTNIAELPLYDIRFGITEEGSVERVTIDGRDDYRRGDVFLNDVPVIVSYHLMRSDDPRR